METKILLFLWFLSTMLLLRFTPNDKIKAMSGFYKVILPRLPKKDILKILRSIKDILEFSRNNKPNSNQ